MLGADQILSANVEYKRQAIKYANEAEELRHLIVQLFAAWRETVYYTTTLEAKVRIMREMEKRLEEICEEAK